MVRPPHAIVNDVQEFYAMGSFVNPRVLGSLTTFKRVFQLPIEKGGLRMAHHERQ